MSHDARRIVSLLPGATEWVCHLGLKDRLVGISHECDYPLDVTTLPRVTRSRLVRDQTSQEIDAAVRDSSATQTPLYELETNAIIDLNPDLILTQSLCNVCAVSERDVLKSVSAIGSHCRLLDLRAQTFEQVISDAMLIADATGRCPDSLLAIDSFSTRICRLRSQSERRAMPRPTVTLLEWVDPLFCAGHWTPQLIEWAGGDDPIGRSGEPSRLISPQELRSSDPDMLLVACCGMDGDRTRKELELLQRIEGWSNLRCVKTGQVHTFDGSAYFNRPGPRLADALESVTRLIDQWSAPLPV